jgi:hypothetical protein
MSTALTNPSIPEPEEAVRQTLAALTEIEGSLVPVLAVARKHRAWLEKRRSGKILVGGMASNYDDADDSENDDAEKPKAETYSQSEINAIESTLVLTIPTLFYIHL